MEFKLQHRLAYQATSPINPLDSKLIVENGESPTAVILAIAILISILVGSITKLIRVIIETKSGR